MKDSLLEIVRTLEKLAAEYKPPLEVLGEGINRIRLTENFGFVGIPMLLLRAGKNPPKAGRDAASPSGRR